MNSAKTVIFCGTPEFAIPSLQALLSDDRFEVQLVITQPDKPVGRSQEVSPPPVKVAAINAGIAVIQPENINAPDVTLPPADFLVTVAYGQIVKQHILDHPNIAAVNIHGSLLPHWRGASPMQHSILEGDAMAGVSIQEMVEKLDAGPILGQREVPLHGTETIEELHDVLAGLSAMLLTDTFSKPLQKKEQNEADATFCKKLSRADGETDPQTMTAEEIDRHVRALVPWPGVTCDVEGQTVKLLRVHLTQKDDAIELQCKNGTALYIELLQEAGKKPMHAQEWLRGKQKR